MAKPVRARIRLALCCAAVPAFFSSLFTIGEASAGVGVTSATDGDPLGKPPQEVERVLRIGIDVQANELITTNANDRAHLVFLDGSSLTVGPNAQLTIDRFVFDPNTKTGELAINASKGVMRLVGGKISKSNPITVATPSSTIGIRGGITIIDVKTNRTESVFVFGKDMTVKALGQMQVATRPGSMIATNLGSGPAMPTLLGQGALNAQLGLLEGKHNPQGGGSGRNADNVAETSGFSSVNSGQSVRIVGPGNNFGSGPGPNNRNFNDTILTALSNANQGVQTTTAVQDLRQQQPQQVLQLQQQAGTPAPPLPPPPTASATLPTSSSGVTIVTQPGGSSLPPVINLPQPGTATYAGGMIGIANGRFATGTYQNSWNFTSRSGNFSATFDGAQFQGMTFANGNSRTFSTSGPVASSNTNRQIELNGTFLGPGSQPQAQGGLFGVRGPRYIGGGAFLGEKR